MSAVTTAATINPLTTARMEELDNVEKDVIAILENTGEEDAGWPNRIQDAQNLTSLTYSFLLENVIL